ncbi:YicC/YloC family endoribonuclease [Phaeovulum sp.]|uniref:YicC/YloC family endoribonuclease n=1 Tax=Phaeovulum sp. TaxID=2934796 RepID=UPI00356789BF
MTGFAARQGAGAGMEWAWDLRAVNGKGFDLRLRLPEGIDGLEAGVREAVARVVARGSVQLGLKLSAGAASETLQINPPGLTAALAALAAAEAQAAGQGLELARTSAAQVLGLRGVTQQVVAEAPDPVALREAVLQDLAALLDDFDAMRRTEGAALARVLGAQIDRIATLTDDAALAAEARRPEVAENLRAALARVADAAPGADPARVAAELAMLAIKADVTEEIDRLRTHVAAARAHLAAGGPVGRKLEFLTQEFVREANTLCSKSGSAALTAIGLDLKHVIDQMREQIQNLE